MTKEQIKAFEDIARRSIEGKSDADRLSAIQILLLMEVLRELEGLE